MKYKIRGIVCLVFAAGLALVVRAEGEAPSTVPGFSYDECNPNTMRFFLDDGTVLAHEVDA